MELLNMLMAAMEVEEEEVLVWTGENNTAPLQQYMREAGLEGAR